MRFIDAVLYLNTLGVFVEYSERVIAGGRFYKVSPMAQGIRTYMRPSAIVNYACNLKEESERYAAPC